jgi:hypothetical protein
MFDFKSCLLCGSKIHSSSILPLPEFNTCQKGMLYLQLQSYDYNKKVLYDWSLFAFHQLSRIFEVISSPEDVIVSCFLLGANVIKLFLFVTRKKLERLAMTSFSG